jgi:hypothetical protein
MARAAERPDSGAAQGAAPHTGRLSCRLSGGQTKGRHEGFDRLPWNHLGSPNIAHDLRK